MAQLDALRHIDLVFLDLEMPGMDGYQAAALIRAHPHFQRARLVAYTVHISELNAAFDRGFDAFLGKPLNAEAFGGQLARILAGERVWYLP
jgi:CheY-like chemotaxis protein